MVLSVKTKKVGNKEPKMLPKLLAMDAIVVTVALPPSLNHVAASKALELRKNGYHIPPNVFPISKNQGDTLMRVLIHIPAAVNEIPSKI